MAIFSNQFLRPRSFFFDTFDSAGRESGPHSDLNLFFPDLFEPLCACVVAGHTVVHERVEGKPSLCSLCLSLSHEVTSAPPHFGSGIVLRVHAATSKESLRGAGQNAAGEVDCRRMAQRKTEGMPESDVPAAVRPVLSTTCGRKTRMLGSQR